MKQPRAAAAVLALHLGVFWAAWAALDHGPGHPGAGRLLQAEAAVLLVSLRPVPVATPPPETALRRPPERPRPVRSTAPWPGAAWLPVPRLPTDAALASASFEPVQAVAPPGEPVAPVMQGQPESARPALGPATEARAAATLAHGSAAAVSIAEPAPTPAQADRRECPPAPHPAALRERGIEGEVRLLVRVGADGRAAEVRLQQPSGWRLFDHAAMAQAQACRFQPARRGVQAVESWVEFPVRFSLRG